MNKVKTIGVLTSGGDSPGMNAAIRAVVRTGIAKGMRVIGIRRGYNGLINGDMIEMNLRSVSDIIHRGGTVLYTARSPEFKTEEGLQKAVSVCKEMGIEGIAVIGGDGSFRGASDLSERGIPCVGIPGTIDNDVSSSESTIGFDTAINTVMQMVDKLRDTTESHDRCSVVEVMGRHAGYIALHAGIAVGATCILVPEVKVDIEKEVIPKLQRIHRTGKKHFIIIVAEGIGRVDEIAKLIEEKTGIESRPTILGHVQRGGSPTVQDRLMASEMGYYAVELLSKGIGNRVIAVKDNKIVDYDIHEALKMKKPFETKLYEIAHTISI
ncbi:6-phosphofructokinase [[Clostridium] cellulosi]|uniref:ATP-dependent 6-phosphofructokinase n=1 Tax=[Clostridium] cellulosi TaxID=29343 RepID=A0A078KK85_9FIRM|nr:6-phosphofructokinase [[Clostridium] cellulosi]